MSAKDALRVVAGCGTRSSSKCAAACSSLSSSQVCSSISFQSQNVYFHSENVTPSLEFLSQKHLRTVKRRLYIGEMFQHSLQAECHMHGSFGVCCLFVRQMLSLSIHPCSCPLTIAQQQACLEVCTNTVCYGMLCFLPMLHCKF